MVNNEQTIKKPQKISTPRLVLVLCILASIFPLLIILALLQINILNYIKDFAYILFLFSLVYSILALIFGINYKKEKYAKSDAVNAGIIMSVVILVGLFVISVFAIPRSNYHYDNTACQGEYMRNSDIQCGDRKGDIK